MNIFSRVLFCTLPALSFVHSAPLQASHESGYLRLTSEQAVRFAQCKPKEFNQWYQIDKGQDLKRVITDIMKELPIASPSKVPPGITLSAADSESVSTPSPSISLPETTPYPLATPTLSYNQTEAHLSSILATPYSIPGLTSSVSDQIEPSNIPEAGNKRKKRQAEEPAEAPPRIAMLQKKGTWPPPARHSQSKRSIPSQRSEPEHKILLLLPGFQEPYNISGEIILDNVAVGLCTQPPAGVQDNTTTPWEDQAIIQISDSGFSGSHDAAIQVNDNASLNLNSVRIDAHQWSSNYSIVLLKDRAKASVSHSTLIRLNSHNNNDWGWGYYDLRSLFLLDGLEYGPPELKITDSRLYQGMVYGAIVTSEYGGNILIEGTEQVVSRYGIAWNLSLSSLDVVSGSISGCDSPVSNSDYANLGGLPASASEFCPTPVVDKTSCAYYGLINTLNFRTTFRGSWYITLSFYYDRLKIQGLQNTANQLEDFHAETLCEGHLVGGAQGAVEFLGRGYCPPGYTLATTQVHSFDPNNDLTRSAGASGLVNRYTMLLTTVAGIAIVKAATGF